MNPVLDAEALEFQREVREFIRASLPGEIRALVAQERMDVPRDDQVRWHRILRDRGGWCCPGWPAEHGGPGWSDLQQYLFERELALEDAPRLMIYGVSMLGPTLMAHGSDAQRERFLPAIRDADILWCQGFSEPNAGSDLAALGCRAKRRGDTYVVDGSKMWTSDAHISDWMFGLFRTDAGGAKQHGITFLLLDLSSPGVEIAPIRTFDGGHEVNQVFFDAVEVPVDNRVGEEHRGWSIAKYLLGLERFGTAEVARSRSSLRRLRRLARTPLAGRARPCDEPDLAARIDRVEMDLRALEITEQRFLFGPGGADALGPEASMLKVRGTEIQQRILQLTLEALGPLGCLDHDDAADRAALAAGAAHAARNYFNYRKTSIYSGSNEIQRNIIAKAVLGL